MLRKTFQLIKNNPNIIIFQVIYIVISFFSTLILYSVSQSEISSSIDYILYCVKLLISFVLGLLLGIIFLSGFGHTLSETLISRESGITTFFVGNKKYFMKSMLSVLVLYIINVVSFAILLPTASQIILKIFVPYGNDEVRKEFYYIFIYIINIFIMPFSILFLPAIYIDHYDILPGLIAGMKLAVRNYLKLVWVLSAMYIPVIINIIFIKDAAMFVFTPLPIEYVFNSIDVMNGNVFSISFIIMYFIEGVIFLVSAPLFFVIYNESSSKRLLY